MATEYRFLGIDHQVDWQPSGRRAGYVEGTMHARMRIQVGKQSKLTMIPLTERDLISIIRQCTMELDVLAREREAAAERAIKVAGQ